MKFKTKAGSRAFWVKLQKVFVDRKDPFFCYASKEFQECWENVKFKNEVLWLIEKFAADKFGNKDTFLRDYGILFIYGDQSKKTTGQTHTDHKSQRIEFLKWVINEYFRFRDRNNQLTQYALLCGYIQTKKFWETEVSLSQDGIFKVTVSCPNKGHRTGTFSKLQLARKYYNSIKK